MRDELELSEADRQYEEAFKAHYDIMDLALALKLYRGVIDIFPDTLQAESSRLQLLKIVHAAIPPEDLLDTLQELATAHLESKAPTGRKGDDSRRRAFGQGADRGSAGREQERQQAEIQPRAKKRRRGSII